MKVKTVLITAIVCLALGFIAGWIVNGWRLSAYQKFGKAEQIQLNADHFRDAVKKVKENATEHVKKSEQLKKQIAELRKELINAQKTHPLPVDCSPDPERMRVLKNAVTAANTAAGQ